MTNAVYRYIRYSELLFYLARGWKYWFDLGNTHGNWSCAMIWCCGDCVDGEAP